jgi:predicted dehydrogenase
VVPAFQYPRVDLVPIGARVVARAAAFARPFGAHRYYTDHQEMLDRERPDAVFIVTSYHPDGRVQATDLALDALAHGAHVWMEKPTAASVAEVRRLIAAADQNRRFLMTGLKKIFFPAIARIKEIIAGPDFGRPASIYIRYPQDMPPFEARGDLRRMTGLLDHIYHPAAIIHYLMGPIGQLSYEWEPVNGSSMTTMRFVSGAVGTLHLAAGASGSSPLERLEVIGAGANVVLENGVKLTYSRRAERG